MFKIFLGYFFPLDVVHKKKVFKSVIATPRSKPVERGRRKVGKDRMRRRRKAQHPDGFEPYDLLIMTRVLYHCATTAALSVISVISTLYHE